jgi:hypothetical protein
MLLILVAVGYFSLSIGRPVYRYVRLKDAMQHEARRAATRSDQVIRARLAGLVDSLGLPESAKNIRVRRSGRMIFIYTEYYEHIEFPGFVKEMYFSPQAQGPF